MCFPIPDHDLSVFGEFMRIEFFRSLAWLVLDEARDYFRTEISENYAAELAQRAEMVFANHPFWQRKFQNAAGRKHLLSGLRHWLAGVLAKEQPALCRDLPDRYEVGTPLPSQPLSRPKMMRQRNHPARPFKHFVHGCELLAVWRKTLRRPLENPRN
jgi:hypothetical protein